MNTSPAALIQHRRIPHAIPRWLNAKQVGQLMAAADKQRDYALVDFIWSSGCRISEVVGARVDYVQWKERVVKVFGKGQKERLVPMGRTTANNLRAYLQGRKTGPLFLQLGINSIATRSNSICKRSESCMKLMFLAHKRGRSYFRA